MKMKKFKKGICYIKKVLDWCFAPLWYVKCEYFSINIMSIVAPIYKLNNKKKGSNERGKKGSKKKALYI